MSGPSLQHLRIFAEVARHGSFSRTSVVLGIAQPTISRQISELESHWQGTLFYRTGRGVELSELGHKALARTMAILREVDHLTDDMRSEQGIPSGEVTVAAVPSLVSVLLPALVKDLRAERPGIGIRILEGFSEQVIRWVSEGTAEIGLYARYFEDFTDTSASAGSSRILLVTPGSDTELPDEIPFTALEGFELVLPMQPNALRHCIDVIARQRNLRLNIVAEAVSFMAQKEIAAHCGYSFLAEKSLPTLKQVETGFRSMVIRDPYLLRKIVLSTSRGTPLTHAAREVADRLGQQLRNRQLDFEQS
ncbi:LysR family transcriptional regulator [Paracoccus pantotrophus]|uniref:LysR family transcriptional regulator n=1 Tax=Paracoccus pantotrophus TaxID=82367 RepID=UPI00048DEE94|nr:LysR family transcriptional regulator [Paracoccus pantotrophus]